MGWTIKTLSGRGMPITVDAEGYDTYLAAEAMADAEHDGEYEIVRDEDDSATDRCAYCDATVTARESVPAIDDDSAWTALANEHSADCEWVRTRAHRTRSIVVRRVSGAQTLASESVQIDAAWAGAVEDHPDVAAVVRRLERAWRGETRVTERA